MRNKTTPKSLTDDPLLTEREVAAILRCSTSSLSKWRLSGRGPKYVYVGSRVRYHRSEIAAYIEKCTRISTSDPGAAATA